MLTRLQNQWVDHLLEADDTEAFAEKLRTVGLNDRLLSPEDNVLLSPVLMPETEVASYAAKLDGLGHIMRATLQSYADGDLGLLLERLGYSAAAKDILGSVIFPDELPFGRWDILVCREGWKVLEFNVGGATGGQDDRGMQAQYDRFGATLGVASGHVNAPPFSALKRLLPHESQGEIIVCDDDDELLSSPISALFAARSLSALTGKDVQIIPASALCNPLIPGAVFELFTLRDCITKPERYAAYLSGLSANRFLSINRLCNDLMMNKGSLALVYEAMESGRLIADDAALVKALLPFTTLVDPKNIDRIEKTTKDRLLVKAANGFGGKDVHCGWQMSQQEWDALLENAMSSPDAYIAQDRAVGQQIAVIGVTPHFDFIETSAAPVLGVFCDGPTYAGGFVRASLTDASVVNAHSRAAIGVLRLCDVS